MADCSNIQKGNIAEVVAKTTKSGCSRQKIKIEKESPESEFSQRNMPKKYGRKTKEPVTQVESYRNRKTIKTKEALIPLLTTVKTELPNLDDEVPSERLRSLRSRRIEVKLKEEPDPGPSIKEEPPEYNETIDDHWCETIDDTDSDPAWTPSSKSSKNVDSSKLLPLPGRKRGPKPGRRSSSSGAAKRRKTKTENPRSRKKVKISQPDVSNVKEASTVVSKGRKNVMSYAAGNEISVNKYVTADVRVKSADVVQYLGPNLSEAAKIALSEMEPKIDQPESPKDIFDELKDDFSVYIQSLLSQGLDPNFLSVIKDENDDFFLVPIKNIEAVSEEKKKNLMKDFVDGDWKNSANIYPCVNILDNPSDFICCEVCKINQGIRLLQFYGQPYDWTTLSSIEMVGSEKIPTTKTQFSVCDKCSISVSLYNRLHHHKYNLFIQCRSKASEVKDINENVKDIEDLLNLCLEDTDWRDSLFQEQVQIWKDSDKIS